MAVDESKGGGYDFFSFFEILQSGWTIVRTDGLRDTGQEERYLGEIFGYEVFTRDFRNEGEKRFSRDSSPF